MKSIGFEVLSMKKQWFLKVFHWKKCRRSVQMSKEWTWTLFITFLTRKKIKQFSTRNFVYRASSFNVAKTHIFASMSNNRESYRNQWYYQSGGVCDFATLNELALQKIFRVGNFWIFFLVRNVQNNVHVHSFDI